MIASLEHSDEYSECLLEDPGYVGDENFVILLNSAGHSGENDVDVRLPDGFEVFE